MIALEKDFIAVLIYSVCTTEVLVYIIYVKEEGVNNTTVDLKGVDYETIIDRSKNRGERAQVVEDFVKDFAVIVSDVVICLADAVIL